MGPHRLDICQAVPRPEGVEQRRVLKALHQSARPRWVREAVEEVSKLLPDGDELLLLSRPALPDPQRVHVALQDPRSLLCYTSPATRSPSSDVDSPMRPADS